MGEHAKLSASGSHIWLNCTPSIKMSEGFPDQQTAFTEEGTLAHRAAELKIGWLHELITDKEFADGMESVRASKYYTEELKAYIRSYVDYVEEVFNGVKKNSAGPSRRRPGRSGSCPGCRQRRRSGSPCRTAPSQSPPSSFQRH